MGNTASVTSHGNIQDRATALVETLDLVLFALPVIRNLSKSFSSTIGKFDKRYGYLGNIQSSTGTLKQQLEVIKSEGSAPKFELQIMDLAGHLEEIFNPGLVEGKVRVSLGKSAETCVSAHKEPQRNPYQRLKALQVLLFENIKTIPVSQPQSLLNPETARSPARWKKLQRKLENITDDIQCYGDDFDDPDEDGPVQTEESSSEMWDFAGEVFKAMSCNCPSASLQQLRLKIGTYKAVPDFAPKSLCLLLEQLDVGEHDEGWGAWNELLIRDHLELKPKVRFAIPDESRDTGQLQNLSESERVACLHTSSALQDPSTADLLRLDFILNHGFLYPSSNITDERTIKSNSLEEEISLKTILASSERKWPETAKWALAIILSWSLYHLYGGPWVRGGWSRENIVFFRSGSRIPLRPFLGVSTLQSKRNSRQSEIVSLHRYPEILELGVILLELHLGKRLEDFLGLDRELVTIKDFFMHAIKAFVSQKEHMFSIRYRNAVDTCLRPDPKLGPNATLQDVRVMLLQHVVRPLEDELMSNFQEWFSTGSLDEQAEKYDLAWERRHSYKAPRAESAIHPLFRASLPTESRPVAVPLHFSVRENPTLTTQANNLSRKFELFGDEKDAESSKSRQKQTDAWKANFQALVQKYISPEMPRVKVAVIDTGIDRDHMDFFEDERIKEARAWTKDNKSMDTCGHGTHVAGIILELTDNVDIYVGKIAESRVIHETGQIVEAVRYAREVWKVHIISLSLGIHEMVPSLQAEVDDATRSGILVFAAASNDGGNAARAYPARHDGVFCIHSATSEGNKASFNPTPARHEDNFSVVGDAIGSSWPGNARKYLSGTSFATPVAVAVAAFMFGYVSRAMPEHSTFPVPALSPRGMRRVFRLLKEPRDGYDWISPLRYFKEYGEDKIRADIKHVLTR